MGRVAAIGDELTVRGFGLAGALVLPAGDPDSVLAAWRELPDDIELVILTAAAAGVLGREAGPEPLVEVLP